MKTNSIEKIGRFLAEQYLEEIKRENMPQIKTDDVSEIIEIFSDNGVLVTREKISPSDLTPVQEDYSEDKIQPIIEKMKEEKSIPPVFVSEDYAILDGHHRCLAAKRIEEEDDKNVRLPIVRIDLPKEKALVQLIDAANKVAEDTQSLNHAVVYAGTFQPFHEGNFNAYQELKDRFGLNNVYIATSNRSQSNIAPLNFKEKQEIMSKLYPIPKSMIREVKNSYDPTEILTELDEENTVFVLALTERNVEKLNESETSRFFKEYDSKNLEPFREQSYYTTVEEQAPLIGETRIQRNEIAQIFSSDDLNESAKKKAFKRIFGSYNQEIYNMVNEKFMSSLLDSEVIEQFLVDHDIREDIEKMKQMITEVVTTGRVGADDGPVTWFSDQAKHEDHNAALANRLGYEVVSQIGSKTPEKLKQDGLPYASFYPIGTSHESPVDNPDSVYFPFVRALAQTLGNQIIDYLGSEIAPNYDPNEEDSVVIDEPRNQVQENPVI